MKKATPVFLIALTFAFSTLRLLADDPATEIRITRKSGAVETISAATKPATVPTTSPYSDAIVLGVNLEGGSEARGIESHSAEFAFADCMRQARRFGTAKDPWNESAVLGTDGWAIGAAGTVWYTEQKNVGGTYKLRYKGTAPLTSTSGEIKNSIRDPASGYTTADLVVNAGPDQQVPFVALSWSDTIRELAIAPPGLPAPTTLPAAGPGPELGRALFTPRFIESLKPYKAIRFMDWLGTNGSPIRTWADRPMMDRPQWTVPGGIPLEACIALCNVTGAAPYLNVPDQADGDYVRRLLALVRAQLRADLPIYLEWSNEVWNGQFIQYKRNFDATRAEIEGGDPNKLGAGALNIFYSAWNRIAYKAVWLRGQAGNDPRVRIILASQVGYLPPGHVIENQLRYIERTFGPPSTFIYAIACAPYLGLGQDETKPPGPDGNRPGFDQRIDLTVDQIVNRLDAKAATDPLGVGVLAFHTLAAKYGIRSWGYEGLGPDIRGGNASIEAKIAAQYDPRIGLAVEKYYRAWYSAPGAGTIFDFNHATKYKPDYFWGKMEDARDFSGSKFRAVTRVSDWLAAGRN